MRQGRIRLTIKQILTWADAYHARTGRWPTGKTRDPVPGVPGESWSRIDAALYQGCRGLPGGDSLTQLLVKNGKRPRHQGRLPGLTEGQIVTWAKEYRRRTGDWPDVHTRNPVPGAPGESWARINGALYRGHRGLPGGSSLVRLLAKHGRKRYENVFKRSPLTEAQIFKWAKAHHKRTGQWPRLSSGRVVGTANEKWRNIDIDLRYGYRTLPGGSSLTKMLEKHPGVGDLSVRHPVTVKQILAWAKAHYKRTGRWPNEKSGPIPEAHGETWLRIQSALRSGHRGLPGGQTLFRLAPRRLRDRLLAEMYRPPLTIRQILEWSDAYQAQTGRWPCAHRKDPVPGAKDVTWWSINSALYYGRRGFPGGSSLAKLLAEHRGKPYRSGYGKRPPLTEAQIFRWAKAYRRRTGRWPSTKREAVVGVQGETWRQIDRTLRQGGRGLQGGSSLSQLIKKRATKRGR